MDVLGEMIKSFGVENSLMYYGDKVKLRAVEETDLDVILGFWNDWELRRYLIQPYPFSRVREAEWLQVAVRSSPPKDRSLVLAIEEKRTGEFLGTASLDGINLSNRTAEFGIAIMNKAFWGKGYGTDATRTMLWVAFHVVGLHSVFLHVLDYNARGMRAYEKAGFKKAGVLRDAIFIEGKFHDLIVMDVLDKEFFEKYPPGTFVSNK